MMHGGNLKKFWVCNDEEQPLILDGDERFLIVSDVEKM
jgi:hypothetical protein